MSDYYDRQGKPITMTEYATLHSRKEYMQVARAEVTGPAGASVSTVWLGADHRWGGGGPPIIFETMVFGGPCSDEQERYTTDAEARAGHERWVHRVQLAADPERGLGAYLVAKRLREGYYGGEPLSTEAFLVAAWLKADPSTEDGLNDRGVIARTWPAMVADVEAREASDDDLLPGER